MSDPVVMILLIWLGFVIGLAVHYAWHGESEIEGAWREGVRDE